MKIDAEKQTFAPVTLTLESEAEFRFILDVFGHTTSKTERVYGLPANFMYDKYGELSAIAGQRGVEYADKIDIIVK